MTSKVVVVLGMHRCGTSTLTRGLRTLGIELGDTLLPPVQNNNAKGFWEDSEINGLNVRMLASLNRDWHFVSPVEKYELEILHQKGLLLEAAELLKKKVANRTIFGFKDPRTAVLIEIWNEVFLRGGYEVYYLVAIRNPISVANSLHKRDGFSFEKSYLMWLVYVLSSLSGSVAGRRALVDYDLLMSSPEKAILAISDRLGLSIDNVELHSYCNEFIDKQLQHSMYDVNDLGMEVRCPSIVKDIYVSLFQVAQDNNKLDEKVFLDKVVRWKTEEEKLKPVLNFIDNTERNRFICETSLKEVGNRIQQLNEAVSARDSAMQVLKNETQVLNNRLADQILSVSQLISQRDNFLAELNKLRESTSWRITFPIRAVVDKIKKYNLLPRYSNLLSRFRVAFKRTINIRVINSERKNFSDRRVDNSAAYSMARIILASGRMNRAWYGGAVVSTTSNKYHEDDTSDSLDKILSEVDRVDTNKILKKIHKGSETKEQPGGGPSPTVWQYGPITDIELFLAGVNQPLTSKVNSSFEMQTFSILTSFYKHIEFFEKCAMSVEELCVNSGSTNIEWIIVNDDPTYSKDNFEKMIPESIRSRTIIVDDRNNYGITRRLNQLVEMSNNVWIIFLDCDDLIDKDSINVLLRYINRYPLCRYISSAMVDIDESDAVLRYRRRVVGPQRLIADGMIAGHLKAIKKDVFNEYGMLDEYFDGCQDYEFALRVAFREPILFIPEYLYYYRWHDSSQSVGAAQRQTDVASLIVEKYVSKYLEMKTTGRNHLREFVQKDETSEKYLLEERIKVTENAKELVDYSGVVIVRTQGNRISYLLDALNSLSGQEFPIKAIVVVHGNEEMFNVVSNATKGTIEDLLVLHAPEVNRRRGYPINVALKYLYESSHEYGFLTFLDDDDIIYPMFSSKIIEAMKITDSDVIYASSNRRIPGGQVNHGYFPLPPACLLTSNFIPINSYGIRFKALRRARLFFDESLEYLEDWHFLIQLLKSRLRFFPISEVLSEFRIIGDGNTAIKKRPELWSQCQEIVSNFVISTCLELGRYELYKMLTSYTCFSNVNVANVNKKELEITKEFIDRICPMNNGNNTIQ